MKRVKMKDLESRNRADPHIALLKERSAPANEMPGNSSSWISSVKSVGKRRNKKAK